MNSTAVNIHVQIFEYLFSILRGIHVEVELLRHVVILHLTFWGNFRLWFPQWLQYFTFLPTVHKGSNFSMSLPTLLFFLFFFFFFNYSHPSVCELIPHCGFPFSRWLMMFSTFYFVCWPSVYLIWRHVYPVCLPIYKLGCLSFCLVVRVLYIFW